MLVYKNRVEFENANKPIQPGVRNINEVRPYSKNPNIATVFHHLGLVDEVGSAMKKVERYSPVYFGGQPTVDDDEIFTVNLPITSAGIRRQSVMLGHEDVNDTVMDDDDVYTRARQSIIRSLHGGEMSAREMFAVVSEYNISMANFR